MPITAFSSFTDGLEPNRRSREHFITNINLEDDRLWVPYADGVWFQPCCFNVTSGGFTVVLKGLPGSRVGTHYHVGTVRGWRRPDLSGQGGERWLCRLRGWIHSSRADSEVLSRGRSRRWPAGSARAL